MADILSAVRVWQKTTDTSSPYDLAGTSPAQSALRTFVDAGVDGQSVFVMERHITANEWQLARITVTDAATDTFVVDQVLKSSNSDSQVSWSSGTRDVFLVDIPGLSHPLHTLTDDTTLSLVHHDVLLNQSTAKTYTLPPVADYAGKLYNFKHIGTANGTIAEDAGDSSSIEGLSGVFGTALTLQRAGQQISYRSDGTKWRRMAGLELAIGADVAASTSGSILYIDSNNDLAQDNSNLFYDATNKRVGLLTASPSHPLDIDLTASPADTKAARATIGADNDDGWRCEGTITGTGRPFNAVLDCSDRVICSIQNTNTGGGNAAFEAITASGSGDPRLDLTISGEQAWTLGIDNSDSNKFKLDSSSSLDSSPLLEVTITGLVGINKADPAAQLNLQPRTLGTIGFIIEHAPGQTADSLQVIDDSDTVIFVVDAAGKLGVGVPDPANLIDAETAGADAKLRLSSTGGSNDAWVNVDDGSQDWSFGVDNDKSGAFKIVPTSTLNAAPAIICDTGLDVGIGFLGTSSSVPTTLTVRDDPGNSPSDSLGLAIINDIAAVANVSGDDGQSYSPALRWEGQGWKTDATAASQSVEFRQYLQPVQGAAAPTGNLLLEASINGGAYSTLAYFSSGGGLYLGEQAAGNTDAAGYGQIWVKDDTPNTLWFTDDGGTDYQLGVAAGGMSIGGTVTGGTPGSVLFVDTGPVLAQDNADFFWNTTTKRLGLGTASPVTKLHTATNSTSSPRGVLSAQHNTGTGGARVHLRKSRGTEASPTTIAANDNLGRVVFTGHDGSNYLEMAAIEATAVATVASTRIPTELRFYTATDAAPSVLTQRMVIDKAGRVGVNIASPASTSTFHVQNGSSGANPHPSASTLVVETSARAGINILGANNQEVSIFFGSTVDNLGGFLEYKQSTALFRLGSHLAGGQVAISSATDSEAIRINASQLVGINTTTPGAQLHVQTSGTGVIGQIIRATAGQTGALTQWQTSTPTTVLSVLAGGNLSFGEGINVVTGTTTGTKIGTATSQKLGFFNATPIIQPTTGVVEASFVENAGGTAVNVDSTFGGYTLQQIAQALQNLGLLA